MIKGKKAGEKYLTPWLFLVWALIGVAVIAAVIIYYSAQINVKGEEADILAVKLADCLVDNGYLTEVSDSSVFEECYLDEKMFQTGGDFYFSILVNNKLIEKGNKDLTTQCGVKKDEEHFAECEEKMAYALNQSDSKILIKIITASNQLGEKL